MAKIDDIYEAVDDFGLITSAEAAELGMSRAEMVQQEKLGKLVRVARGVYPHAHLAIAAAGALCHRREGGGRRGLPLWRVGCGATRAGANGPR